jgi:hypothetical protein
MRLLVIDMVRRQHRWMTALTAAALATGWWAGVEGEHSPFTLSNSAFTLSMGVAFAVGPQRLTPSLWPRAIWYLPISKRDAWRATWLLATVGATVITTAAKLLGMLAAMLIPPPAAPVSLSAVALSGLFDFAYAGFGCALLVVTTRSRPAREPWRHIWNLLKEPARGVLISLGFLAPMLATSWGGATLPVGWSELTPRSAALLAAALTLSIATYFHTLDPAAGFIPVAPRQHPAIAPRRAVRAEGLTGLRRLLLHEYAWSALTAVSFVMALGVLVFGVGALIRSPWSLRGLVEMGRLLLDDAVAEERGRVFDLLIWAGLFAATLLSRLPDTIRHLRVLPLAASRLNLLLVAWPAMMLLTVWVGLAALRYLVLGPSDASWQPAMLLALIGSSAIARAMRLRWPLAETWIAALWLCAVPLMRLLNAASSGDVALIGLAAIAAAAALNHYTLRRSATYRRPQPAEVSLAGPW